MLALADAANKVPNGARCRERAYRSDFSQEPLDRAACQAGRRRINPETTKEIRIMRYMLMMHAPRGDGTYQVPGWSADVLKAHIAYMHRLNKELVESGEL